MPHTAEDFSLSCSLQMNRLSLHLDFASEEQADALRDKIVSQCLDTGKLSLTIEIDAVKTKLTQVDG
jgi:hypothetical protein